LRKDVIAGKSGHVAVITLNRPPANSVNRELLAAVGKAVADAVGDADAHVIVITGGDKVFSEGLDLDSFLALDEDGKRGLIRLGRDVLRSLEQAPKPTIAAMAGEVLGAGLEIAVACDMRLASEDALLGHPEVSQGLTPLFGGANRLERLVGMSRSRSLIFTGEPIPAWEALEIGLVGKVVPREALLEEARIAAARIASQPKGAVQAAKMSMLRAEEKERKDSVDDAVK
jgi:enoyl-CoA hydratase